jgi:NADPH:quinone reductase-like Zn-dependent oxidoreductase
MENLPSSNNAVFFEEHGSIDKIIYGKQKVPSLESTEILVKMKYAGLNHLDLFVLQGWPGLNLPLPHIMGSDGAGIVKAIGENVKDFSIGDKVTINPGISCGFCEACLAGRQNFCNKFHIKGEHVSGTFVEYFKINRKNAFKLPPDFPLDLAAAAPLNFLTAWRMLVTLGKVSPRDIILIQGAGGGVASAAIQIAKLWGATVITTTSSLEKIKKAKQIGADYVINYQENPDYSKYIYKEITKKHGVDIAIDSVGQATFLKSMRLLHPGGKIITCGATTGSKIKLNLNPMFWKQLQILGSTMSNQQEFHAVMDFILQGKLTPIIDKVFLLSETKAAEEYLSKGHQFGKVLVQPK